MRVGETSCNSVLSPVYDVVQLAFQGHSPPAYVVLSREVQLVGIFSQSSSIFALLGFWLSVGEGALLSVLSNCTTNPDRPPETGFRLLWLCRLRKYSSAFGRRPVVLVLKLR